jgi:phosphoglucomutase
VARHYGLVCLRRPIGFKHLTELLAAGRVDVAGEESRGFAWAPFARDKDAVLAGCLVPRSWRTPRRRCAHASTS